MWMSKQFKLRIVTGFFSVCIKPYTHKSTWFAKRIFIFADIVVSNYCLVIAWTYFTNNLDLKGAEWTSFQGSF